jgi:transposase
MSCAGLCWSRSRFVRFARDERQETALALLAACFEELGGVPVRAPTDRMGCLKAGRNANQKVILPKQQGCMLRRDVDSCSGIAREREFRRATGL